MIRNPRVSGLSRAEPDFKAEAAAIAAEKARIFGAKKAAHKDTAYLNGEMSAWGDDL